MRKILLFIVIASLFSCASEEVKAPGGRIIKKNERISNIEKIEKSLARIDVINKRSPGMISADMEFDGAFGKKKVKTVGKIVYSADASMMNVIMLDYIFKSPVVSIFQEGADIRIYPPSEKKAFADNSKKIKVRNYLGINLDYGILYSIMIGKVPLIENYKVKSVVSDERGEYLILENKNLFQTISFNSDIPDKILFIDKETQDKYEIYFRQYFFKDKTAYFKKIRIVSQGSGMKADIQFDNIILNMPVKVKPIAEMNLPNDVPVVKVGD